MTHLSPLEYYTTVFAQQYASALADADPGVLDQPELSVSITIEGAGGSVVGLRARGRELDIVPGGIADADMHVRLSADDWRVSTADGANEALLDYVKRRKVQVAKSLRGTVAVELERSNGSLFHTTTIFGNHSDPAVTIMMTSDDYAAMLRGDLNGQMAFMMGRLKFEGSLPLLMAVGSLAG
jgi:putative sterol carrier protein